MVSGIFKGQKTRTVVQGNFAVHNVLSGGDGKWKFSRVILEGKRVKSRISTPREFPLGQRLNEALSIRDCFDYIPLTCVCRWVSSLERCKGVLVYEEELDMLLASRRMAEIMPSIVQDCQSSDNSRFINHPPSIPNDRLASK
jgi:hypothetical protein